MNKITTKDLVMMSLLVAITIILSRFLSISTPIIKIGFSFVPLTIAGILYGPKYTMIIAVIADLIGVTLITGDFFPGFTVTTALVGLLNTGNIYLLSGYGFMATLPTRAFKAALMVPIKAFVIYNVSYPIVSMKNMAMNRRAV